MRTAHPVPTDWAYLAGLIDGEGCISAAKQHHPRYFGSVRVVNTDERMLRWIVGTFDVGAVTVNNRHGTVDWKPLYKWRIGGRRNLPYILTGVLPYLVIKKEQAVLALELATRPEVPRQEEIYLELQGLKHANSSV